MLGRLLGRLLEGMFLEVVMTQSLMDAPFRTAGIVFGATEHTLYVFAAVLQSAHCTCIRGV